MSSGISFSQFCHTPGQIKQGTVENGIFSGLDWFPTLMAAAGKPNITDELLKGVKLGDRTYRNGPPQKETEGPIVCDGRHSGAGGDEPDSWLAISPNEREVTDDELALVSGGSKGSKEPYIQYKLQVTMIRGWGP